ncbi:hypothetical protein VT84_36765 [Gemmata sp. SH-PL17]|uniref:TIGR02996 domain-containing protein n=1 Tax=Gemmata sp. SH-PL17 TaxID=1630693 RepID=UPI0004B3D726|nr:TIGR02996 domain-containing protein [Gemmata sp. SH-PL17]AMV30004.1 hypothetical protein VT84_36765 [Gemmata sp. SH-PL17]
MSDRAAFRAAIRANPTDVTARLVFADWRGENAELGVAPVVSEALSQPSPVLDRRAWWRRLFGN